MALWATSSYAMPKRVAGRYDLLDGVQTLASAPCLVFLTLREMGYIRTESELMPGQQIGYRHEKTIPQDDTL
jgi:hypothetical protein